MSTSASAATPPRRIPLFDNARFAAILLVVVGHSIQRLQGGSDAAAVIYLAIYAFHIPLFTLVSGYFAKDTLDTKALTRIVTDIAVPYLIFESVWTLIQWLVAGVSTVNYANASWTLWFLLALIGWRLLLPLIAVARFPLTVSVLLSVGAGYLVDIDNTLALSRMLGLLPFFVLGWRLKTWAPGGRTLAERWEDARGTTVTLVRFAAGALFAALVVVTAVGLPLWQRLGIRYVFFYNDAYPQFGYPEWWAGALRLGALLLGTLLCLAFVVLLPRRSTWFTGLGAATMYVYLLHTFPLYPLRQSGLLADTASDVMLVVMLVAAAAITLLLASPPVRRIARPLVEPRIPWLLRRP